jgi:hypothetical protein
MYGHIMHCPKLQEGELESMRATVQTLQQENDSLRTSSAQVCGISGAWTRLVLHVSDATMFLTWQVVEMSRDAAQGLREALKASEAQVERLHAQRIAEVAITKAALCAQVRGQLSILTAGKSAFGSCQLSKECCYL